MLVQLAKRILLFLHERISNLEDPRSIDEALKGSRLVFFWKCRVASTPNCLAVPLLLNCSGVAADRKLIFSILKSDRSLTEIQLHDVLPHIYQASKVSPGGLSMMRKLEIIFVHSIGAEIQTVLLNLKDTANEVSEVRRKLADLQTSYENYQSGVLSKGGEGYGYTPLLPFKEMQDAIETLNDSVIKSLAIAGIKADEIRSKVLVANNTFSELPSSQQMFLAIDSLVIELDNMCIIIAKTLDDIPRTMKLLKND